MPNQENRSPVAVVGIGASAGGLEAFTTFFQNMPNDSHIAFVLLPHLAPDHPSILTSLIAKQTSLRVNTIVNNMPLLGDNVYVLPPGKQLSVKNGLLQLKSIDQNEQQWLLIDRFFTSMAIAYGERCIAIIMSGTGNHGTLSFEEIKLAGGMIIAQDPQTTKFSQMPECAIDTGLVDMVLAPEKMPSTILSYISHPYLNITGKNETLLVNENISPILEILKSVVKYDFSGYRKNMLLRRIQRRMHVTDSATISEYTHYLSNHPNEANALSNELLIGVTAFFRDKDAFSVLEERVIPDLVSNKKNGDSIRIWVPACSSGEEVYSLAILICEEIEKQQKELAIHIFASDIDKASLNRARRGTYSYEAMSRISSSRRQRFFQKTDDNRYQIINSLRENIVFACQNIIADAPFSRLDLISCRNFLIYLQPELQRKVLDVFHFSLNPQGYLVLGPSESLGQHSENYQVISKKWRIFQHVATSKKKPFNLLLNGAFTSLSGIGMEESRTKSYLPTNFANLFQRELIDAYAPAAVLINRAYHILQFHGPASDYLEFPKGAPSNDLLTLLRDGLRTRVRTAVHRAIEDKSTYIDSDARVKIEGHYKPCILTVRPISDSRNNEQYFLITFEKKQPLKIDGSPFADSAEVSLTGSQETNKIIEQLEYELNATSDELQTSIAELEQSNEDLKSSNEEVMSMNEELQSANEELETSKEELQSMNEELNTVNTELVWKVEELEKSHDHVNNLLSSTDIATLFLDIDMRIILFNPVTTQLLSLQKNDIGRQISDFSFKFEDKSLLDDCRQVIQNLSAIDREVSLQRGGVDDQKIFLRRIVPYRTAKNQIEGVVVTFTDVTHLHNQRRELEKKVAEKTKEQYLYQESLKSIMQVAFEGLIVLDKQGIITDFNVAAESTFGYAHSEIIGKPLSQLFSEKDTYSLNHFFRSTNKRKFPREFTGCCKNGRQIPLDLLIAKIDDTGSYLATVQDLTEQKALKKAIVDISSYEQEKIGIELHDSLGQKLTGISLLAGNLKRQINNGAGDLGTNIDHIVGQLSNTIGDIRNICHGLAPLTFNPQGLPVALSALTNQIEQAGLLASFKCDPRVKIKERVVAIQFYRIAQEATNNAIKYANATEIDLEVSYNEGRPALSIRDNGKGFDVGKQLNQGGIGLKIMRYRASAINARLEISSTKKGTEISCRL
ncbi:CheR family methyltransferase [Aliiglaciecola sp. LCG003]|uniref:CheR family methyltransferase n=1 Tax=Aliiglaciecola sp. LCG003 TaxID=3053655 RepID=UPI002573BD8F|nr:CheR family methyltransferase [Aliiglaciecola sp. LCG003]WJG09170.1 CheR family methyltransferase [Aliiglaciecola sp. LCG003]